MKLPDNYLTADMARRVNSYKITHPKTDLILLGTDNDCLPLPTACMQAMRKAVDEMGHPDTLHTCNTPAGYGFLAEAIIKHHYARRGVSLESSEIFIGSGAKPDIGSLGDLLRHDNSIGVTAPTLPAFIGANASCGRAGTCCENGQWSNVTYISCPKENRFIPTPPQRRIDIIYMCYPNNPTGTALGKEELKKWVNYALKNDTLLFFDASYEAYIRQPDIPHSIYEIKGAKKVAIEMRSFADTAGQAGVRCGYTVIPKEITAATLAGERIGLNRLWTKRLQCRTDGASYIGQRAAEALFSPQGQREAKERTDYYMANAQLMRQTLEQAGLSVAGGENAPFLWVETPPGFNSWRFFEHLLGKAGVVCMPGTAYGPQGEGFVKLSAIGTRAHCLEGAERMARAL